MTCSMPAMFLPLYDPFHASSPCGQPCRSMRLPRHPLGVLDDAFGLLSRGFKALIHHRRSLGCDEDTPAAAGAAEGLQHLKAGSIRVPSLRLMLARSIAGWSSLIWLKVATRGSPSCNPFRIPSGRPHSLRTEVRNCIFPGSTEYL